MGVILKPVITEKATKGSELNSRYTFQVDPHANKIQIKEAVEAMYGVDVVKVRTMIYAPEVKTRYTKAGFQVGKTNKIKKAIVQVEEGQEIDIYGNA